jgi:hypothetical protein
MLCDSARANVYEDVVYKKNVRTSMSVLEKNDPVWQNKQTVVDNNTISSAPTFRVKATLSWAAAPTG